MEQIIVRNLKKHDLVDIHGIVYEIKGFSTCPTKIPKRSLWCISINDNTKKYDWIAPYDAKYPIYDGIVYLTPNHGSLTKSAK